MKHISDIKDKNKKDIIRLLYKKPTMSKKRAAIELGLSPSVITKLCSELIGENIIIEKEPIDSNNLGRKEIQIKVNPNYKRCFGITINHISTTILLVDMDINVLYEQSFHTDLDSKLHLEKTVELLKTILKDYNLTKTDILAIGISIKGNTDGTYARFGIWNNTVNVKNYINEKLDIPVVMDNGIRCSAMLEQLYSNEDNFIFIKYMEPGIGGALILNGNIERGERNSIVDFGHMIVETSGDYCPICKRKGCLESIISIENMTKFIKTNFSKDFFPILWEICKGDIENINIANIIKAAEEGCIELNKLFKKNAYYFAVCIINTQAIMDIKKIIIIGDLFSSKRFVSYFRSAIYEYQLTDIYDNIEFHIHENVLLSPVALSLNEFLFKTASN